ncbi:flagellar export chaperone FliS [Paenibacillus sp. N1-5-1-14]|uniref:flagellar export chaperone FliS n=1 Tax=Paenibacillus radicibacter TaxID=2972488 RepID=UPI002158FF4B|nr:flagellar export chaperone FliS [Paenibacillus radicibacter]MCR8645034.1 flagellar export chaperone FliS [Paenibacillus radicibacter]
MINSQLQKNRYLETAVQTATPAQLLIMLCDGAVRFTRLAIEAMKNHQYEDANRNLYRTQDIIKEFMVTLDQNSPIAEQLMPLYEYYLQRLIEANVKKQIEPAEEVLNYLIELKETWFQAAKIAATGTPGVVTHG